MNPNSQKGVDKDNNGVIDLNEYSTVDNSAAYIYYDVFNQYGESIRTSTNITWTLSSCDDKSIDTTRGIIKALKNDESFTYGTLIYVTGVNVKSGKSVTASLTVGMEQAIDKIEIAGFVSKNDKTNIIENLPKDFSRDTYSLLFKTYDQNGNIMEPQKENVKSSKLTFISDNILLLKSEFKDGDLYTIKGEEYASVTVQPGMYVDKGGEVNITAISNKTGGKTVKNFVIGANGLLKSLTLNTPSGIVADGDRVEIPYIAYDTEGKQVTNYETIARSTNTLNLNASPGTLTISEKEDGTARVVWTDDAKYVLKTDPDNNTAVTYNPYAASEAKVAQPDGTTEKFNITDETDRNISLTTVVVGGESNNLLMSVSDMRRPTSIKSVKLNDDDNNAIIAKNTASPSIDWMITYLDQYGVEMPRGNTLAFWAQAYIGLGDYKFDVKAYTTDNYLNAAGTHFLKQDGGLNYVAANVADVESSTVKYTVVSSKNGNQFVDAGKTLAVSYSVLPISKVSNFAITNIGKRQASTINTVYPNGMSIDIENTTTAAIAEGKTEADAAPIKFTNDGNETAKGMYKVQGSYKGLTVTLPTDYYETAEESSIETEVISGSTEKSRVTGVKWGELAWAELYDFNTAKNTRIDAKKALIVAVDNGTADKSILKKYVTISDERSYIASISFKKNYSVLSNAVISPVGTEYMPKKGNKEFGIGLEAAYDPGMWCNPDEIYVAVEDQYGSKPQYDYDVNYTISEVKENTGEFTHLPDSFVINSNNSTTAGASGVEIGDKFKLTATAIENIPGGVEVSTSMTVTAGADGKALISSAAGVGNNPDEELSKMLMYGRND